MNWLNRKATKMDWAIFFGGIFLVFLLFGCAHDPGRDVARRLATQIDPDHDHHMELLK